jgi:predicted alpha/beta superfamily hydrolase
MPLSNLTKRTVIALWLVGRLWSAALAVESQLTIRLQAPELASDTAVFITGSTSDLGNWQPNKVPMHADGDHIWSYQFEVQDGTTVEYKYTLGSWDQEAAGADGRPLNNSSVTVDGPTERTDHVDLWTTRRQREIHGQVTGTVRYHRAMPGTGILPRDIIVWLPPGYDDQPARSDPEQEARPVDRYPVLYMHDGQNIIDPATSSFGTDWEVDETCTRLIAEKKIPPLIVVGIYNTPQRNQEYLPGAKGTAYMSFVINELKPFIDTQYRTKPGRESTFVGGSSAGGLSAFMLAWEHPDVFGGAICMSPAFRLEKDLAAHDSDAVSIDYVTTVERSRPPKLPTFFYIDIGGQGLETRLQPGVDAMLAALKFKGLREGRDIGYIRDPAAQHFEGAWAKRFPASLEALLGKHE